MTYHHRYLDLGGTAAVWLCVKDRRLEKSLVWESRAFHPGLVHWVAIRIRFFFRV